MIQEGEWLSVTKNDMIRKKLVLRSYINGSGHNARGWYCLDFMTVMEMWKSEGKGSLIYADGMLYCLDERGRMTLTTASSQKYEEVSVFSVPSGGKGMH